MIFYPSKQISRDTWPGDWPLTVGRGVLQLRTNSRVVFITPAAEYAVNGLAKAERHWILDRPRYRPIDEIWRDDPQTGLKVNIGPLIKLGLSLKQPQGD